MRSITRANQPVAPASVISSAQTMKAPTASAIGTPAPAVTSNAAPGVLQAVSTGMRYFRLRPRLVRPMPRPSAQIHEAVCAGVAPRAAAAWKTMTTELVKPTSTATKPATRADNGGPFGPTGADVTGPRGPCWPARRWPRPGATR
jgi:hypothetical protein